MTNAAITHNATRHADEVIEGRPGPWWLMAISMAFLYGGLASAMLPMLARVGVAQTNGAVFVVVGLLQFAHSVMQRNWSGDLWQAVFAAILIIAGGAMLLDPMMGPATLTLVLGAALLAAAAAQIAFAIAYQPGGGWAWILLAGIIALVCGAATMVSWPSDSDWVKSIGVGVSMLATGGAYLMVAGAAQRALDHGAESRP